ncbi:uncharacterized protein BT62DRAFT_948549 [Guyanagaster necrorhizus]|uniref:R3H domain-containing protein n=1 Tax=Guyanagaster necrorhizus TaxID=856835 RepID=A0A9P7VU32_9AGAR|nr:uncharacterized protein BT62DRAFT_948549 [Guyanagaster necrorhizus MCA 3950]KAG7446740.1 hypothetical protein BT62DRAFT_948549 [Guyanagaster necrorhizus MCA 3950]
MEIAALPPQSIDSVEPRPNHRGNRRNKPTNASLDGHSSTINSSRGEVAVEETPPDGSSRNRRRRPKRGPAGASIDSAKSQRSNTTNSGEHVESSQRSGRQHEPRVPGDDPSEEPSSSRPKPPNGGRRGVKFNAGLTSDSPSQSPHGWGKHKAKDPPSDQANDLTSILIRGLSTRPYTDCPICFNAIHPPQPTWSCSPSIPILPPGESAELFVPQYCWTTFHLKCIHSWSEKSYNEVKEAWRARGEERRGEWRCPGCQGRRGMLIGGYRCFCGSTPSPNARLATPHSCGNPCSRPRVGCPHPCPLSCHPGPCPPCKIMLEVPCGCPRRRVVPVRCGEDKRVSCNEVCSKRLNCGKHFCQEMCHQGDCASCEQREMSKCWCGKAQREVPCGEGSQWLGAIGCGGDEPGPCDVKGFSCDSVCQRFYDCCRHACQKSCHPPSSAAAQCPFSPVTITTCPCGKRTIAPPETDAAKYDFASRTTCSAPIPTCDAPCNKLHATCEHPCKAKCHIGECPPCSEVLVRPCRCGNIRRSTKCGDLHDKDRNEINILCTKACPALRACGRHQCNRLCCPLASLAVKTKGKKRMITPAEDIGEGPGGLHECDLICGKMLTCGNHRCEERDHKGPCGPCLRSSFEELICFCERTVLEPPIPCGTEIKCSYPCVMPAPPCGHPKTPHPCHGDDIPCPPCFSLTKRLCACGKNEVDNIKCSLPREKVGCGTVCGKLMGCGFHRCERICHSDDCGVCTSICGKSRKLCLPSHHPCADSCHAPSACSEVGACQTLITLLCPCERIRQSVPCGRSISNAAGRNGQQQLKCTSECLIAKRNARLAEALGIDTDSRDKTASEGVYSDELVGFARLNDKFLAVVEKAFAEFIGSGKKTQVLPHMPPDRRQFVHQLASIYRVDTQMVDQEPHRSVQLIRRIDTRIPSPLLSSHVTPTRLPSRPNLGKLGNLRSAGVVSQPPSQPTATRPIVNAGRGWTGPVSRSSTPHTACVPDLQNLRPASRPSTSVPQPQSEDTLDVPDSWEDDV